MSLASGQSVEVRTRFDGSWSEGFRIAYSTNDGYRVRRASDDMELPDVFPPDQVRPAP